MIMRRISALLATALLTVAAPLALWRWGSLAAFAELEPREWLLRPLTSGSLLALLTAVGWLAWATITLAFAAELLGRASHDGWRVRIPGTRWCRPLVVLLLAGAMGAWGMSGAIKDALTSSDTPVLSVTQNETTAQESPPRVDETVSSTTPLPPAATPPSVPDENTTSAPDPAVVVDYVIRNGDDLWTLALLYLGDGTRWPEIVALNPKLADDPLVDLTPGTVLRLPVVAALPDAPGSDTPSTSDTPNTSDTPSTSDTPNTSDTSGTSDTASETDRAQLPNAMQLPAEIPELPAAPPAPAPDEVPTDVAPSLGESELGVDTAAVAAIVGPLGAAAATALATAIAVRRRRRFNQRPVGKALSPLSPESIRVEQALDAWGAVNAKTGEDAIDDAVFVTIGTDTNSNELIEFDLNGAGLVVITGDPALAASLLADCAAQFIGDNAPSADVTYVSARAHWLRDLDDSHLSVVSDAQQALRNLHALLHARIKSVSDTPLVPAVFLFDTPPPEPIPSGLELAGVSVVVRCETGEMSAAHVITIHDADSATLNSEGISVAFTPHLATAQIRNQLQTLAAQVNTAAYVPAPWWEETETTSADMDSAAKDTQMSEPANIETAAVVTSAALSPATAPTPESASAAEASVSETTSQFSTQPQLLLLGSPTLIGARGVPPARAVRQCTEYCAWILRHPGATSLEMASDLLVAEGTRRSNMSRLRTWLGTTDDGEQYLPDAYSGRIELHRHIVSDWEQFKLFTAGGVNHATTAALQSALSLVRGVPLSDTLPGSWHWAEQWRIEMVSQIRDAAAELTERALENHDLTLASWALEKGTLAAGEDDETLLTLQIRLAQAAGDTHELNRLVLRITRRARQLGEDLSDTMIATLREVLETTPKTPTPHIGIS